MTTRDMRRSRYDDHRLQRVEKSKRRQQQDVNIQEDYYISYLFSRVFVYVVLFSMVVSSNAMSTSSRTPYTDSNHDGSPDLPLIQIQYGEIKEHFSNLGYITGWDRQHTEKLGRIQDFTGDCFPSPQDPADKINHCLKFEQTWIPGYTGRYHAECIVERAMRNGRIGYYGFAIKFDKNFVFDKINEYTVAQFITSFRDTACPDGHKSKGADPATMIWARDSALYTRIRFGSPCHSGPNIREYKLGDIQVGKWHTVVIGASWRHNHKGWFKGWFDGHQRLNVLNSNTIHDTDARLYEFRVGIYPNWYSEKLEDLNDVNFPAQTRKVVYIDNVRFGTNFEDADPLHPYREEYGSIVSRNTKNVTVTKQSKLSAGGSSSR